MKRLTRKKAVKGCMFAKKMEDESKATLETVL